MMAIREGNWVRYDYPSLSPIGLSGLVLDKDKEPTAESLRAAAKVLEEKAVELDKPKLTKRQQEYYDDIKSYHCMSRHVVSLSDDDKRGTWLNDTDYADKAIRKEFFWNVQGTVTRSQMVQSDGQTLPVVTLCQHGYTYTAIDWNKL